MPEMPNLEEIMKMAQEVQAEMQKAQENLDKIEVEGAAGGGLVKVRASAKGRIVASTSTRACFKPSEKAMLEDLGRGRDQRCPHQGRCRRRSRASEDDERNPASARLQISLLAQVACLRAVFAP
jgi:DNA-binding protein YbaB